jgi:cytochrome c oxidase cbb3-type subunit III
VSARADETSNTPPQTQVKREPTTPADSAEQ